MAVKKVIGASEVKRLRDQGVGGGWWLRRAWKPPYLEQVRSRGWIRREIDSPDSRPLGACPEIMRNILNMPYHITQSPAA